MAAGVAEAVRWVALSRLYVGDRQALIFLLLFGSSQKVKMSITDFYKYHNYSKTNNSTLKRNLVFAHLLFLWPLF